MNLFKRWNRILGWSVFAVAAAVYLLDDGTFVEPVGLLRVHRHLLQA